MSLKRKAGSPNWYYDFKIGGRRFSRSTGTADQRQAKRIEREAKAQAEEDTRAGRFVARPGEELTVAQVFTRYLKTYAAGLKWGATVGKHLEGAMNVLGPDTRVSDVKTKDLALVLELYADTGVTPATINRRKAVLRRVWTVAADIWDIPIQKIAWAQLSRKEPRERVRYLRPEEASRLIKALEPHPHIAIMVMWSLATGCRRGETNGLTWDRVNIGARTAEVPTKGGGVRTIALNDQAIAALTLAGEHRDGPVFDTTNHRKIWERALRDVGLEDFRWHDLRHTHATWLGQAGAGLHVIQRALGHSQIQTTTRYAHATEQHVAEAVSRLPKLSDD